MKAVFKPDFGEHGKASNEEATYRLDQLLGFGFIPTTIQREIHGLNGSLQYFVPGARQGRETPIWFTNTGDLKFFDYLAQVEGRHGNNFLVRDGLIFGIDNANAFTVSESHLTMES